MRSGIVLMAQKELRCAYGVPIESGMARYKVEARGRVYYFCSNDCMRSFESPKIAYFSMEVGIRNEIPTYSGGLGVLAGDIIRSSADLRIPLIAVTLVSRRGYVRQKVTEEGEQLEYPEEWDPSKLLEPLPSTVKVTIGDSDVRVRAWLYEHLSPVCGVAQVLFLDTDVDGNAPEDREITHYLYGGDDRYRLKQEIVLGIGGVRMLKALGFDVRKYHMNEGHSSLLTLELLRENGMDSDKVSSQCVFTTHTPVEAAFDKFSYDIVEDLLGREFPLEVLKRYGGQDMLNMTSLALNLSKYVNGVTRAHAKYSSALFRGHQIWPITNGVHSYTWTCQWYRELFDKYIPAWANEPELLVRAIEIPAEEVWDAHVKAKMTLLDFVKRTRGVDLDPNALTLGFARRATEYKRATLIFSDLERLREVNRSGRIQLVFAGKAHPRDESGKRIIREIHGYKAQLKDEVEIAYLENYDLSIAAMFTSGVDVWLNTPVPPFEASGTSGMKAAHNGVINFSVLDGWWIEGCIDGVTGWAIGPSPIVTLEEGERRRRELSDLYNKLEYVIVPTFYSKRDEWITMMKNSIGKVAYYFNSHRMMRRYITQAYLM